MQSVSIEKHKFGKLQTGRNTELQIRCEGLGVHSSLPRPPTGGGRPFSGAGALL
jgi:hypothetical protein